MKQLILASQSPRRSEILKNAGYQFVPLPVHVSEIPDKNLTLDEQIIDIARRKAKSCAEQTQAQSPAALILAADTMVCLDQIALGKPETEAMAKQFLLKLSGKAHQVKTAIYLIEPFTKKEVSHIETTEVFFRTLSPGEIDAYILTKEPMDKAGAYGIQGLGGKFVEKIIGDFNNVVGLPLQALENLFKLNQWVFSKTRRSN